MGAFPIFCKSLQQIFMAISELITHPLPLPRGEYMESPLGRGKEWVPVIMNNLEVSLHEFTPIQVKYPPTAFFFAINRECSLSSWVKHGQTGFVFLRINLVFWKL